MKIFILSIILLFSSTSIVNSCVTVDTENGTYTIDESGCAGK